MANFETTVLFDNYGRGIYWNVPAGVQLISKIECWGAGGWATYNGGGGGAYAVTNNILVEPGEEFVIYLGNGAFPQNGNDPAFSYQTYKFYQRDTFIIRSTNNRIITAAAGGRAGSATDSGTSIQGLGGDPAGCIGDLAFSGGNGGLADMRLGNQSSQRRGGAGGGSGGPSGPGTNGEDASYPSGQPRGGQAGNDASYPANQGWGGGFVGVFAPQQFGGGGRGENGSLNTRNAGAHGGIRITLRNYNSQQLMLAL